MTYNDYYHHYLEFISHDLDSPWPFGLARHRIVAHASITHRLVQLLGKGVLVGPKLVGRNWPKLEAKKIAAKWLVNGEMLDSAWHLANLK